MSHNLSHRLRLVDETIKSCASFLLMFLLFAVIERHMSLWNRSEMK